MLRIALIHFRSKLLWVNLRYQTFGQISPGTKKAEQTLSSFRGRGERTTLYSLDSFSVLAPASESSLSNLRPSSAVLMGRRFDTLRTTIQKTHLSMGPLYGRGERTQTFDLSVPNRARYQLRHTPIVCKSIVIIASLLLFKKIDPY